MRFVVLKPKENILNLVRRIGYRPIGNKYEGELNCVRPVQAGDYPRFHLYIKQGQNAFIFNLHLDQKKPSYGTVAAHSGEYEGLVIEAETHRIRKALDVL